MTNFPEIFSEKNRSKEWHKIGFSDVHINFETMNQPIEVNFDFALDDSNFIISIRANAKFIETEKFYNVYDFHTDVGNSDRPSIFPEQQIMKVESGDSFIWVHKDSQMESALSRAIGSGLENKLNGEA